MEGAGGEDPEVEEGDGDFWEGEQGDVEYLDCVVELFFSLARSWIRGLGEVLFGEARCVAVVRCRSVPRGRSGDLFWSLSRYLRGRGGGRTDYCHCGKRYHE